MKECIDKMWAIPEIIPQNNWHQHEDQNFANGAVTEGCDIIVPHPVKDS